MLDTIKANSSARFFYAIVSATLLLQAALTVYPEGVSAHKPPRSGGGGESAGRGGDRDDGDMGRRHRRPGWRRYWDRRWDRNWDPVWSPYDNDRYIDKTMIRRKVVTPMTWTSIAKPGSEIPNFHEVHPWLFRGGQPNEEGLNQLYQMGVRTIVDLRCDPEQIESERQLCQDHNLNFVSIPIKAKGPLSRQAISKFMQIADAASTRPDRGAVFVHCHLGADRTGAMIGAFRELKDKYTFDKAHDEMLSCGFHDDCTVLKSAVQNATKIAIQ